MALSEGHHAPRPRSAIPWIFAGLVLLCAGVIRLIWVILARHATFSEFAETLQASIPALAAILGLVVAPAGYLVFGETKPGPKARAHFWRLLPRRGRGGVLVASTFGLLAALLFVVSYVLAGRPNSFDQAFDNAVLDLHIGGGDEAAARLTELKGVGQLYDYEARRVAFLERGIQVYRLHDARVAEDRNWRRLIGELDASAATDVGQTIDWTLLKALALAGQGDAESALDILARDANRPQSVWTAAIVASRVGDLLLQEGRYLEALSSYDRIDWTSLERSIGGAANRREVVAVLRRKRGIAYAMIKDLEAAEREFEAALALATASRQRVFSNLGFVQMLRGKYPEATRSLETATRLANDDFIAELNLAVAHALSRDYPRAKDALDRAREKARRDQSDDATVQINKMLIGHVRGWIQLRENPLYPSLAIDFIRREVGLQVLPGPGSVGADRSVALVAGLTDAAKGIRTSQVLHGLEFIAVDFLWAACNRKLAHAQTEAIRREIKSMPAIAWLFRSTEDLGECAESLAR